MARRVARKDPGDELLAALLAQRDVVDEPKLSQRQAEDEAFAAYARAGAVLAGIDGELAAREKELDELRAQARSAAAERRAGAEAEQADAVAALVDLGRPMTELAAIFRLPVKRLRALSQRGQARSAGSAKLGAATASGDGDQSAKRGPVSVPAEPTFVPGGEPVGPEETAGVAGGAAG